MAIPGFLTALALKGDLAVPAWMTEFSAPDLTAGGVGVRTYSERGEDAVLAQGSASPIVIFDVPPLPSNMNWLARCWIVSHKDNSQDDGIRGLYLAYFKANSFGNLSVAGDDSTMLTTVAIDFAPVTIIPVVNLVPLQLGILVTNSALSNLSISMYVTWMMFKTGNVVT